MNTVPHNQALAQSLADRNYGPRSTTLRRYLEWNRRWRLLYRITSYALEQQKRAVVSVIV